MKLHHLKPAAGAKKDRTRVGRGRAGTRGKTAGRGTKGWGARHNPKPGFEGGQMPLQRRVPKLKGFTNPNRVEYAVVNVGSLGEVFAEPSGDPTVAQYEQALREGAAKMGADAVVVVYDRMQVVGTMVTGPWWAPAASPIVDRVVVGLAIRYTAP